MEQSNRLSKPPGSDQDGKELLSQLTQTAVTVNTSGCRNEAKRELSDKTSQSSVVLGVRMLESSTFDLGNDFSNTLVRSTETQSDQKTTMAIATNRPQTGNDEGLKVFDVPPKSVEKKDTIQMSRSNRPINASEESRENMHSPVTEESSIVIDLTASSSPDASDVVEERLSKPKLGRGIQESISPPLVDASQADHRTTTKATSTANRNVLSLKTEAPTPVEGSRPITGTLEETVWKKIMMSAVTAAQLHLQWVQLQQGEPSSNVKDCQQQNNISDESSKSPVSSLAGKKRACVDIDSHSREDRQKSKRQTVASMPTVASPTLPDSTAERVLTWLTGTSDSQNSVARATYGDQIPLDNFASGQRGAEKPMHYLVRQLLGHEPVDMNDPAFVLNSKLVKSTASKIQTAIRKIVDISVTRVKARLEASDSREASSQSVRLSNDHKLEQKVQFLSQLAIQLSRQSSEQRVLISELQEKVDKNVVEINDKRQRVQVLRERVKDKEAAILEDSKNNQAVDTLVQKLHRVVGTIHKLSKDIEIYHLEAQQAETDLRMKDNAISLLRVMLQTETAMKDQSNTQIFQIPTSNKHKDIELLAKEVKALKEEVVRRRLNEERNIQAHMNAVVQSLKSTSSNKKTNEQAFEEEEDASPFT